MLHVQYCSTVWIRHDQQIHDGKMRSLANPWCRPIFRIILAWLFWKHWRAQWIFYCMGLKKKSGKIIYYRELWYQNRINSQICKEKHRPKYFPLIPSQSKQIFIFSFVTILSAYGFLLPLWSSLCVFKDNKHTFWPSVGWTEM